MALDPLIPLRGQQFNILPAIETFNQARDRVANDELRKAQMGNLQSQVSTREDALALSQQKADAEQAQIVEADRRRRVGIKAQVAWDLLEADPTGQSTLKFMDRDLKSVNDRIESGLEPHVNNRDIVAARKTLVEEMEAGGDFLQTKALLQEGIAFSQAGQPNRFQRGANGQVFDATTGQSTYDPQFMEQQAEIDAADLEHKEELAAISAKSALTRERASGMVKREGLRIEDGLTAAEAMPIMKRADKLLDLVDTGKIEQAKLWAKKWFQIENANEVELDNLMGKQIIKQLKPVFGAQFTKAEGDWLKEMEANFGKSTEGNRILIRQGMDLVSEKSRIGIEAAIAGGDERSARTIQNWLDWEFSDTQTPDQPATGGLSTEQQARLDFLRQKAGR